MEVTAWLLAKGHQSIRILRDSGELLLFVQGPGPVDEQHRFEDMDSLLAFQRSLEHRLFEEGWQLLAMHERRTGPDRRSAPRGRDRRRAAKQ